MKSGFVILAGRSNVGKSTMLNALVGTKVAIMTPKPQTTRHPIRGILHDPRGQIVFVDTPGLFLGKKDALSKRLNQIVKQSFEDIEAVVYVVDPTRAPGREEEQIQQLLRLVKIPVIVAVNKSDLMKREKPFLEDALNVDVGQHTVIEVSAKTHGNLNQLVEALFAVLPEGPPHYPDMQMTDLSQKDWLEEVIREKCFLALDEELPYTINVTVDDIEQNGNMRIIHATISTTVERYKGMIIGRKGSKLKDIGTSARKEIEAATGEKVFLELKVDVDSGWQKRFR
jgi:GTP-binding protein Era